MPEPNSLGRMHRNVLVRGDALPQADQTLGMVLRFVPNGRKVFLGHVLHAARNHNPEALRFWAVYADLTEGQRAKIDFGSVCAAADVKPDDLMAVVVATAMRVGSDASDLTAAVMHPRIVHQTAKSAMRIGGEHASIAQQDRQWMLENRGFISSKKGGITINANASSEAKAAAAAQPSVPTFAESVVSARHAHLTVQRQLTDGADAE